MNDSNPVPEMNESLNLADLQEMKESLQLRATERPLTEGVEKEPQSKASNVLDNNPFIKGIGLND